ncbi:MAG: GntR family transcriptional regulator [Bacillota bacterium]
MGSLEPLQVNLPLAERAYQSLKAAILSLSLKPGQPLVETALAQQLCISKTPVRDALRKLEKEGLVVFYPYKGFYVAPVSRDDICEVYYLRRLLEGAAAREAAKTLSEEQLAEGEHLLELAEEALERGDEAACCELGNEFHRFIVQGVHNRRLEALLDNLSELQGRFSRLVFGIPGRMEKSTAEHRRILEALRKGDGREAEEAVYAHIDSFLPEFLANERIQELTEP